MSGINILRRLLLKEAALGSGQASGIMSIGDSVRDLAEKRLQSYLMSAQKKGVDIDKFGEQELKYMLEMNKPKNKMKVISQDDPEFKGVMDSLMGKKKSNVIEGKFGKSFAEEVRDKDTKAFKVSREEFDPIRNYDDKVADDMFQGGPASGDPKYDADMLAEFLAEDAGKIYSDLPTKEQIDFYDRAYKAIMRYKRDNSDFAGGGVAGMLGERQNFKMGRRAFLKMLAGIPAGIAALKTGITGLGGKKVATEVAKEAVTTSGGTPPPYFFNLVKKIKNLGDDVTSKSATTERQKVTKYKDYELTEDLTTGEQTIQKKSIEGDFDTSVPTSEEVYMNYKPGKGQADEATGKVADEYVEDTSYVGTSRGNRGEIVDTVDGVPDEVIQEGTVFEDNVADFITKEAQSIKKASGGIARMLGQ